MKKAKGPAVQAGVAGFVRNWLAAGIVGAAVLGALSARADVTLGPGDTLDWNANTPAASEKITATGGTIIFNSDTQVDNNFYLGGEVAVTVNNDVMVRFSKTFYQTDPSGRLVMPRTFRFGSTDGNKFAFLPENSIAFAPGATDAQLRLAGWASMQVLPDKWSNPVPFAYGTNCLVCFYGGNMVTGPAFTIPEHTTIRMTSPTNIPATTVITVPAGSIFESRPARFDPTTSAGSGIDDYSETTERRNDIVLAGGTFKVNTASTHKYWGSITGTGTIDVPGLFPAVFGNSYHYFYGDVSGLDARSTITIGHGADNAAYNNGVRLNSDFHGTVKLNFDQQKLGTVSFGFQIPTGSGMTNENWYVAKLCGGSIIGPQNGNGGARLQFTAKHHIHVGTLSGKLALHATTNGDSLNSNDLTVDTVADNTILYVKNGLRLHFGTVGKGVKIRYMADPVSSKVIEVASGTIEEIKFLADLRTKPVYLHGSVGLVTGPGKVIASNGSRVGFVDAEAEVAVNSGTVALGDETLLGAKPALWFDASDLSTYAPLYKSSYHSNGTLHAPSTLLGADKPANVYTNGFPLIEKWFDKRPSQTLNFFWNNRWQDANSFYPQFYPFIVPNGLNGKPILSFGMARDSGLSSEWAQAGAPGNINSEHRRMHLMQSATEGHAVYVHTCVMVFGSERGGGRCVLGGYKGYTASELGVDSTHNPKCGDHFLRNGSGYGVANGIFQTKIDGASTNLYETWVNGTSVVCTNTPMSGSWDVISFHTDQAGVGGRAFRNIGAPDNVNEAGGQDYAEILVFTNKLTNAERMSLENYLAGKWGLAGKQPASGTITLGANAAVVGSQSGIVGTGTWITRTNDYAVLNGSFTGTVGGAGTLTAAAGAQAPKLASDFTGSLTVQGGNLSFTYANGAFAPALVAADADLTFPAAPTVTVTTGGALAAGDYPLVSGKTLAGLTDCTLVHDIGHGMKAKLVRTESALVLRVMPSGITVIFR